MDSSVRIKMEEDDDGFAGTACMQVGRTASTSSQFDPNKVKTEPREAAASIAAVSRQYAPQAYVMMPVERDACKSVSREVRCPNANKDGGAHELKPVGIKTPKYSGRSDWEAFHAQFELLARASGWSEEQKALQLALCLTDDALSCLLLLDTSERADYAALVGALKRRFGQCFRSELLRSELHSRQRNPGEPLRSLANDIESMARRAYAHISPSVQSELARDQFIRALSPPELRIHTQLARPLNLSEALELALEREMVVEAAKQGSVMDPFPPVRAVEGSGGATSKPEWVEEITEMIRGLMVPPPRRQQTQNRICWGCGQQGHMVKECPTQAKEVGNRKGAR